MHAATFNNLTSPPIQIKRRPKLDTIRVASSAISERSESIKSTAKVRLAVRRDTPEAKAAATIQLTPVSQVAVLDASVDFLKSTPVPRPPVAFSQLEPIELKPVLPPVAEERVIPNNKVAHSDTNSFNITMPANFYRMTAAGGLVAVSVLIATTASILVWRSWPTTQQNAKPAAQIQAQPPEIKTYTLNNGNELEKVQANSFSSTDAIQVGLSYGSKEQNQTVRIIVINKANRATLFATNFFQLANSKDDLFFDINNQTLPNGDYKVELHDENEIIIASYEYQIR